VQQPSPAAERPSPAAELIGLQIRGARTSRAMTIATLAKLAAVSTATISMLERGKRATINVATVDRILAAMDLRLDIATVPLWADIDEAIDRECALPLSERIAAWPLDFGALVSRLDGVPYLLDGLTAAAVQGAPVVNDEFQIALPSDDDTIGRFCYVVGDILARRGEGFEFQDPREPGSDYYTCIAGRIRVRLIDRFQPVLWVDIDPLPNAERMRYSIFGRKPPPPLTKAHLPVVPLTEIQASDSEARRIIDRVVQRRQRPGR
jgi:transcriptional regulator with XRE-family HTH domain